MSNVQLFIDGIWREASGGGTIAILNPSTEAIIGAVALASQADVTEAIHSASAALASWRRTPTGRRSEILKRAATLIASRIETLAVQLTSEQGKPVPESRAELSRAAETFAWHADAAADLEAPRPTVISPQPIGVVGAFTPWNYPAVIVARKLASALAAGCTVVLKAAEETPATASNIVAALEEAGLPPGVVNLVFGDPAAISSQILDSGSVAAFSFTGSTAVGKQLAARAAHTLKRCVLELGGHAPVLVFADADLDSAVDAIAAYKFECAGQSCNAPSRIYVEAPVYEAFVDAFAAKAGSLRVGDGLATLTDMGPMANARRITAMENLVNDAVSHGAKLRTGDSKRLPGCGYFWPPTVLTDVPDSAVMMTEEPFGPIIPIVPFSTFDEVIARANSTLYGLAGYVFTRSRLIAAEAAASLEVGSIGINELRGVPPDVGICGVKQSGYGYEGGRLGIEAFLNLKVVRGSAGILLV